MKLQIDLYWLVARHQPVASRSWFGRAPVDASRCGTSRTCTRSAATTPSSGNGTIDYTRIWPDAAMSGMKHFFVEQGGNFAVDAMQSAADGIAYVKKVLAAVVAVAGPCTHLDSIATARSERAEGCEECLELGDTWVHLRQCLQCGHVGLLRRLEKTGTPPRTSTPRAIRSSRRSSAASAGSGATSTKSDRTGAVGRPHGEPRRTERRRPPAGQGPVTISITRRVLPGQGDAYAAILRELLRRAATSPALSTAGSSARCAATWSSAPSSRSAARRTRGVETWPRRSSCGAGRRHRRSADLRRHQRHGADRPPRAGAHTVRAVRPDQRLRHRAAAARHGGGAGHGQLTAVRRLRGFWERR